MRGVSLLFLTSLLLRQIQLRLTKVFQISYSDSTPIQMRHNSNSLTKSALRLRKNVLLRLWVLLISDTSNYYWINNLNSLKHRE